MPNPHRSATDSTGNRSHDINQNARRPSDHLSVSEHVRDVISRCAQSIYALKLLRSHGMNDDELRTIYKSVVLAKLLHAVPAHGGASPRLMTRDDCKRSFDGVSS